jgi:hypothetical protein
MLIVYQKYYWHIFRHEWITVRPHLVLLTEMKAVFYLKFLLEITLVL